MAISAQDVKKLRDLTNAGMMDCKKALTEANGDFDAAMDLIRKRGQMIASKRADREATEGIVLAKESDDKKHGAIIMLNCETDFVATNDKFVALANKILDLAISSRAADLEALKALQLDGDTVANKVTELSGIIGEKLELSQYEQVDGEYVSAYVHAGSRLATAVAFNQSGFDAQVGKEVAMQVAAMSPVAVDQASIPQETIDHELKVAIEKTKEEMVKKAVDAALQKAGINPAHVDSEEHIESNTGKGWITPEQAKQAREIKVTEAEKAAANLKDQMIQNIAQGRLKKYFKESCLMEQESLVNNKQTVGQYLEAANKGLKATKFIRLSLNA
ncbi:MAG: translation elongation factor Ts [Marinilabiliaceae bacterium]|nr:translation elongation factor Ts [Marinilabiliaceae bacterium]